MLTKRCCRTNFPLRSKFAAERRRYKIDDNFLGYKQAIIESNQEFQDLFSSLYGSFPIGVDIEIEKFPEYNTAESSELFFETIKFYIDEGFIKCQKQVYGSFVGLRLTSKGFSVLNVKPPENLSSKNNIADALKEVADTGKTETIKSSISQTIKLGFTFISS